MTQAEEIQTAIDKLTALKASSTPGPWDIEDGWKPPQWNEHTYARVVAGQPNPISGIRSPVVSTNGSAPGSAAKRRDLADADLVITLHATIDAQLTILAKALADENMAATHTWFNAGQLTRPGLLLARAINGGA